MLSAQTILKLCQGEKPMLSPFSETKMIVGGKSRGLSAASYDVCIAHDLTLGPNPVYLLSEMITRNRQYTAEAVLELWRTKVTNYPPAFSLANTVEDFAMPDDVCGLVLDKSTYARVFMGAMNTYIDPGFEGNLTLELVNYSDKPIYISKGAPIVQIGFMRLDEPTDRPYRGKYFGQTKEAHAARYEGV
jgi:dCTP deaminase